MPNRCTAGSNCVVPADEHWLLDWSPPELASLTIWGKLEWDSGILVLTCVGFLGFRGVVVAIVLDVFVFVSGIQAKK